MKKALCFSVFILFLSLPFGLVELSGEANTDGAVLSQNLSSISQILSKKPIKVSLSQDFGRIPLYFITNEGQVNSKAKFYAKAKNYTLWMTSEGLVFDKIRRNEKSIKADRRSCAYDRNVSRLLFIGANKDAKITAEDTTEHMVNYFIGDDKSKWHSDIETSKAVVYKNIYNGIDLKIYGVEKQIEYDWVVKPDADLSKIEFKYENVESLRINAEGNLIVRTDFGDLVHKRPVSYQIIDGKKVDVEVDFKRLPDGGYCFKAEHYNKKYNLIIDPVVLDYSTYLGGSDQDVALGIAVDSSGAVYITGLTYSANYPLVNSYQGDQAGMDVIVTKLSPAGNTLLYSTYIGGNDFDEGRAIAIDASGAAYIAGDSFSTDFPTVNPYMGNQVSTDVFAVKLSPSGNALIYSTYLGGDSTEFAHGIAVDSTGAAYIVGDTSSSDFPVFNQYQAFQGMDDGFITKLSPAGNTLLYSTCLGGNSIDRIQAIAVDSSGAAYVAGFAFSANFPTVNPYQGGYQGDADAFIAKMSPAGNALVYSTYLGRSGGDAAEGIAVDSSGAAYVTGITTSNDFPLLGEYQGYQGGVDVFVTKLSAAGNTLLYSTYIGGSSDELGYAIDIDSSGAAYVIGETFSNNFPTLGEYQGRQGFTDAFVTKLSPAGNALSYSTYLGGSSEDYPHSIAVDSSGTAYVAGHTYSSNFPLHGEYQGWGGSGDAFITKLVWRSPNTAPAAVINADRFGGVAPVTINFDGSASSDPDGTVVAWRWNFGDGQTGTGESISHIYSTPGEYFVILRVRDNYGDWSPTVSERILVLENTDNLTCSLTVAPSSFKANGKGSGIINAIIYHTISGTSIAVTVDIGLAFQASSGTTASDQRFDQATGNLDETLISGTPGTATISADLDGITLATTQVTYTWPQPPLNLQIDARENRGVFSGEYYVYLSWSHNTSNIYTPAQYKVYRSADNGEWALIATLDASMLEYTDPSIPPGHDYKYAVTTVDTDGDESAMTVIAMAY